MFRNVSDVHDHDRGLSPSNATANARRRTHQADIVDKVNAFLRDYTLHPEGAYADTHLLISRRAHDASNDELAVRQIIDLYCKIRNNVTTTPPPSEEIDSDQRPAIYDRHIEGSFLQAIQESNHLLPFLPPPTILHNHNSAW